MDEIRRLFPGATRQTYLDVAVCGLISQPVREAIDRYLDDRMFGRVDKQALQATVERARAQLAALIGGHPDDVAITKNVSEGLNLFAASLPWQPGDNVVLCPGLEHPNNVYLWYNLRALRGVEVRAVPSDGGRVPVEAMVQRIDARTRLVTVPHVSFSPGFITDVGLLAREAHARGSLVLVDAAQSVGAIRTDVRSLGVDALAVATQKCLLSVYGFGFLWIRRELADGLVPGHLARYGIDLGQDAHETALGDGTLRYQPGARRFDLGNYNYLGAVGADASLRLLHGIGMERIEAHVRRLAARLASGCLERGLPVAGGGPGPHLAHIVAVGASGGGRHDTADDPAVRALYDRLSANNVRLSIRRGVLRFSVAVYNSDEDVDRVLELAR
jgi:selenocysteine lyase/cysteine desulfurase